MADTAPDAHRASLALEDHAVRLLAARDPLDLSDAGLRVTACDACGEVRVVAFRFEDSPSFGADAEPAAPTFEATFRLIEGMLRSRPAAIDPAAWEESDRCPCGAPPTSTRALTAAWLRSLPSAGGAALLLAAPADDEETQRHLGWLPRGGTIQLEVEPTPQAFERRHGRPYCLFDPWTELLTGLQDAAGDACLSRPAGLGVTLVAGTDEASARGVVGALHERGAATAVRVDPELITRWWPAELAGAAERVVVLVLDHGATRRGLGALSIGRVGSELVEAESGEVAFVSGPLRWPLSFEDLASTMARHGRTHDEAGARALREAQTGLGRAERLAEAMAATRPGLTLRAEGTRLTPVRADGRPGRTFDLRAFPAGVELSSPEMARELAFLCDDLPAWSDPSRICPCGASATVQSRLVSRRQADRFEQEHGEPLWVLTDRTVRETLTTGTLEVLAVACARHVRLLAKSEAERMGLDDDTVMRRLDEDAPRVTFEVELDHYEDGEGRRAVLAHGNLIAALGLRDGWVATLHRAAGEPLGVERAEVSAFSAHTVVVADPELGPLARRQLAVAARDRDRGAEVLFAMRGVDLRVPAVGQVRLIGSSTG